MSADAAQTDTAPPDGLHDIVVPGPIQPVWPTVLAVLAALGLALAAFLLVRRWLKSSTEKGGAVPPGERARREFDRIEREAPAPNQFALSLSEAVKDYLSARFQDRVRYETTQEHLARISRDGSPLPSAAQEALRDFLGAAEEVKFGRPGDADSRLPALARQARDLVALCESINAPDPRQGA